MAMVATSVGVLTTTGELTSPSLLPYSLAEQTLEILARENTPQIPRRLVIRFEGLAYSTNSFLPASCSHVQPIDHLAMIAQDNIDSVLCFVVYQTRTV